MQLLITITEGSKTFFSLSLKIPMGTQKNFFAIYRQFGHASSKPSASPGLIRIAEIKGQLPCTVQAPLNEITYTSTC